VVLLSHSNTSGSLGEGEIQWEHKLHVSVSTAFLSSPKLSQVFQLDRSTEYITEHFLFLVENNAMKKRKTTC